MNNNYPAKHFVMSASHNKTRKPQQKVDNDIIKSAEAYRKRGAPCISYKFQRVKNSPVDELKFLMPIHKDIPVLAFQVTYAVMQGIKTAVVGSNEVGMVVDALRRYLGVPNENLVFVHEGEKLSLGNSIKRGARALDLEKNDFFWFVPLDMPFFYNYMDMLYDEDIRHNAIVADFNARERVFENCMELFPRNYYWKIKDGTQTYNVKEPAVFGFSSEIDIFELANEAYQRRQSGGFGAAQVFVMALKNMLKHPYTLVDKMGAVEWIDFATALMQKVTGRNASFYSNTAEQFGFFFDMAPIRCKAQHQDPFRVKDIDAWHDLWYYALAIRQNHGLEGIVPYAEQLEGFNEIMQRIKNDIGVLRDFPEYANQRAKALRTERLPFSAGELIAEPAPGEHLQATVEALYRQMEKFREDRPRHLPMVYTSMLQNKSAQDNKKETNFFGA